MMASAMEYISRILFITLLLVILQVSSHNKILSLAVATKTWPDLSCHPAYSSNYIELAHNWCTENLRNGEVYKMSTCLTRQCCMLHMMGLLHLYRHRNRGRRGQGHSGSISIETIWMGRRGKKSLGELLRGELQHGHRSSSNSTTLTNNEFMEKIGTEILVRKLVQNLYNCFPMFDQVYVVWNFPDTRWQPLYKCIDKALECKWKSKFQQYIELIKRI